MVERYDCSGASSAGAGSTMAVSVPGPATIQWSNSNANRMAQVAASFGMVP
jgi:hypothetical protein